MDWINGLFAIPSALQAVVVLSLVCTVGLGLGKIRVAGISLGIAFVFFFGIAAGSFGLQVDEQMLNYCETFGLVIFVYTLGLSVGPTFFGSFRHEGTLFNLWSLGVIFLGTIMSVVLSYAMNVPMSSMVGILCGATTNTPALGAAQQALQHAGHSGGPAALATAEIAQGTHRKFIISRIWRGDEVIVPMSTTVLQANDNLLVASKREEVPAMEILFGKQVNRDLNKEQVDWNHLDTKVESRVIILSNGVLNGKKLGQLHLRDAYNVNVSRVIRTDIKLLATQDLVLRYGDRLTLVGQPEDIDHAETFLGNSVKTLNEPNLAVIFLGMLLGLALGTIPLDIPGMESPIRLGIAGGPIIMGILAGAFGPRLHFIAYTTRSASLMLRKLGLSLYLACLGLDAGKDFLDTVVRPEGLLWIGLGFALTVVPVVIVGLIALRLKKFDFGTICGILCGSMANPMALGYANDTVKGETSNISYASVYPLGMFARVIIAQILVMFFV